MSYIPQESEKVNYMKKVFALLLCVALLLALPVGCKDKKEQKKPGELAESQISSDLIASDHLYYYAHTGTITSLSNLKVTDKKQDGDTITLKATGTAHSTGLQVNLAADMKYVVKNGAWHLDNIKLNKATPKLTGGPDKESVQMEIENYLAHNFTSQEQNKTIALAIHGEERHELAINPREAAWSIDYKKGSTTAKMTVAVNNNDVAFTGYYKLNFDQKAGWVITGEKQENGQNYLVLYLDTLELKTADKK